MKTMELNTDLLIDAGIPKAYWTLGRDTYFGSPRALRALDCYLKESVTHVLTGQGLYIHGERDTLKTFLLSHGLMCLMAQGFDVRYYTIEALQDLFFAKSPSQSFESLMTEPAFLGIDRVEEPENQGTHTLLKRVAAVRKDARRPLLVASTLDSVTFSTVYSGRVSEFVERHCTPLHTSVEAARRESVCVPKPSKWSHAT